MNINNSCHKLNRVVKPSAKDVKPSRCQYMVSGIIFNSDPFEEVRAKNLGKAYDLISRAQLIFLKGCNHFDNARTGLKLSVGHELKKSQIRINSAKHFFRAIRDYFARDKRPLTLTAKRLLKMLETEVEIRQRAITRFKKAKKVNYNEEKLLESRVFLRKPRQKSSV